MTRLNMLINEVRDCRLCEDHLQDGVRPIVQAHPESRILIAGQAPGRRVHASGVPFDDPSGDRLREWLGVDRNAFYNHRQFAILPMGFCYPGIDAWFFCANGAAVLTVVGLHKPELTGPTHPANIERPAIR